MTQQPSGKVDAAVKLCCKQWLDSGGNPMKVLAEILDVLSRNPTWAADEIEEVRQQFNRQVADVMRR